MDRLSLEKEADENVRYAVAEAIAKIGPGSDALSALMGTLTDDNWYVRHYTQGWRCSNWAPTRW